MRPALRCGTTVTLLALLFACVSACTSERLENRDTRTSRDSEVEVLGPEVDAFEDVEPGPDAPDSERADIPETDDAGDVPEIDDITDEVAEAEVEDTADLVEPPLDASPLSDAAGIAVWLVSSRPSSEVPPVLEAYVDEQGVGRLEVAATPGFARSSLVDGEVIRSPYEGARPTSSGSTYRPAHPVLVAFAPDHDRLGVVAGEARVDFGPGQPDRVRLVSAAGTFELLAKAGARDAERPIVGLTYGEDLSNRAEVSALVEAGKPILLKVYHGSRPFLIRPGCVSAEACAVGGVSHPCVSGCACRCREEACDCPFTDLEAEMRSRALSTARRWVGDGELSLVRLHYVFKRSLGGTSSCEQNGEVDVDAETYGRFFAQAVRAATRINAELGFPLIASLSPMNEANHPLQDGPQENGAGQGTAAGFLAFRDAVAQATGCAPDRYIADRPDVLAMLAEAMVRGEAARADAALAPEVGLSLYLDVEQTDPFQVADDGGPAPIVTPLPRFFVGLRDALAGRDFGDRELWVDTYPGSWAPPWFERSGARHVEPGPNPSTDPPTLVRADPLFAADRAVERALLAADDFESAFGHPIEVFLGEVGWSTFDLDDEAQARFVERLALVSEATTFRDPRYRGWLWFKDTDREARRWPSWSSAELPGGGVVLACDDGELAAWLCMVEVFARMEAAWGLFDHGRLEKPGWARFIEAVANTRTPAP